MTINLIQYQEILVVMSPRYTRKILTIKNILYQVNIISNIFTKQVI